MKNLTFLLILGTCLTFFACSENNDQENMPELDQIFQLKISETAVFADLDLSLKAENVIQDNRCPTNLQCIVAGWVTVLFNFTVEGTSYPIEVTLNSGEPQGAESEAAGYTIRLVTVNPYPQNSNEIDLEDYIFSVVVEN